MKRPIKTVLNLNDVKTLIDCKAQLDAVVNSLAQANWQGARASIAALGIVDRFICGLYNRVEADWLAYLNRGMSLPPASAENVASEPAPGAISLPTFPGQGEK